MKDASFVVIASRMIEHPIVCVFQVDRMRQRVNCICFGLFCCCFFSQIQTNEYPSNQALSISRAPRWGRVGVKKSGKREEEIGDLGLVRGGFGAGSLQNKTVDSAQLVGEHTRDAQRQDQRAPSQLAADTLGGHNRIIRILEGAREWAKSRQ